ncbi:MAG TPA: tRNA (adenosine(37)-N6)-threonylcarbamoyltransferase complex ATPase subunit type 1 TsaE [Candidatus Saccharimonadia bacterium]|nr:tRNA (adenosine(37)-N6)-threonylcarbamoyltransferase complex ATPase subunit type 1 TsaE [Candidatus Saccharimonadia bacterium]
MKKEFILDSSEDTIAFASRIGSKLKGGELIELVGDLGSGKTTFVTGLVMGAGSNSKVTSPSFVVNKIYRTPKFDIQHFDFYRLNSPGLIEYEIADILRDNRVVTIIEWADIVHDILPENRLKIELSFLPSDSERKITLHFQNQSKYLI